jgi:hypothetical protein
MKKKEILEAFGHNAFGLLNQAESQNDMDLMVLAHANLIALTAIQNGHNQHLLACFAAFVEAVGVIQEREVNDAVQDLLREVGINQS